MLGSVSSSNLVAALGPTNTGKTHRAIERMLEFHSGMLGLPLRLLAREVYDRVVRVVGIEQVALITGEEKTVPRCPRYFICTTEAMPLDLDLEFVGIDEIQLCAHPTRGHVFTARLLHLRGTRETWWMGADTVRPILQTLVPTAQVQSFPRLSLLSSAGRMPLRRLPKRSAIVAFSVAQVYELAERVRQVHGGVAVVLGALSPRTRNAQVAMYQSGEVNYLVATDAIGMGLNMDVEVVAFASISKFDGLRSRILDASELAQVAGRAGRHLRHGRFCTLAPQDALRPDLIQAIETHSFPPIYHVMWRNSDLDFQSIDSLIASLQAKPPFRCLRPVEQADDFTALGALASNPDVSRLSRSEERVRLLWDICQIPDFRQLLAESHSHLLQEVFLTLTRDGTLRNDWLAAKLGPLDNLSGDIDALMMRIAFVRTWTYVTHHRGWVTDPQHWQQQTQQLEQRLSDVLHQRLVSRFVSRRSKVFASPLRNASSPFAALATQLTAPPSSESLLDLALSAPLDQFQVDSLGRVVLSGQTLGRLTSSGQLLKPHCVPSEGNLPSAIKDRLQARLTAAVSEWIAKEVEPISRMRAASDSPHVRGLVHQLEQRLGTVRREMAREQLAAILPAQRRRLRALGLSFARHSVFLPSTLTQDTLRTRWLLFRVFASLPQSAFDPCCLRCERPSQIRDAELPVLGFLSVGNHCIRVDYLEQLYLAQRFRDSRRTESLCQVLGIEPMTLPKLLGESSSPPRGLVRQPPGWR